jgi:hypothetical protein
MITVSPHDRTRYDPHGRRRSSIRQSRIRAALPNATDPGDSARRACRRLRPASAQVLNRGETPRLRT